MATLLTPFRYKQLLPLQLSINLPHKIKLHFTYCHWNTWLNCECRTIKTRSFSRRWAYSLPEEFMTSLRPSNPTWIGSHGSAVFSRTFPPPKTVGRIEALPKFVKSPSSQKSCPCQLVWGGSFTPHPPRPRICFISPLGVSGRFELRLSQC